MTVNLRRSGVLLHIPKLPENVTERICEELEYTHRGMVPKFGKLRMQFMKKRLWKKTKDGGLLVPCGFRARVQGILNDNQVPYTYSRVDDRPENIVGDITDVATGDFRPEQQAFFSAIDECDGGLIVSPTGSGKSFFLREVCHYYKNSRFIISAPSIEAVATLVRYLRQHFDEVGQVGGGKNSTFRITVSTLDSLKKVDQFNKVDILVVDEVHRCPASKYMKAVSSCTSPIKRFGFTATHDVRSDGADLTNEGAFGPVIVQKYYTDSLASNSVTKLDVVVIKNNHGPTKEFLERMSQTDKDRYMVWANTNRNKLIAKVTNRFYELEHKRTGYPPQVVVFVSRAEHLFRLKTLMPEFQHVMGKSSKEDIKALNAKGVTVTSDDIVSEARRDELRKQFEGGQLKKVLSTKIWTTAISSNDCNMVVYACGDASVTELVQAMGRASRIKQGKDRSIVILFDDVYGISSKRRSRALIAAILAQGHKITYMSEEDL